jgi:tetratricopeptide (TPR) repeat protein
MTVFQGILAAALVLLMLVGFVRKGQQVPTRPVELAATGVALLLVFSLIWENPRVARRQYDGDDRSPAERLAEHRDDRRNDAFRAHHEKKYDRAIAIYGELLRSQPRDAELLYWRAAALWQMGRTDAALEDYRAVLALQPGNIEAVKAVDRILARDKRWDEILPFWNAYLRAAPNDAEAHFERGGTYFHKGDLESARADARKACELGHKRACTMAKYLDARIGS